MKKSVKETHGWHENVRITVRDLKGHILEQVTVQNAIHDDGLNMFRDALDGGVTDLEIKYVAVGSSNAAIDVTDSDLTTETFRKIMTSQADGATGIQVSLVYIAPTEAVGAIEEIGWFAGVLAGAGAGSGIMISRVLYSRNKTALESIQIERTDTITGA